MSFWDTRAQRKHLALEGLGRELVRKVADLGAEDRVYGAWEGRRGIAGRTLVSSRPSRRAAVSTRPGTGRWRDARRCNLAGHWVLSAACRAVCERRPDTPVPRFRGRRAPREASPVSGKRSSRSATFTARPSLSWARPERSGGPAGLLERARVAQCDNTTVVSIHGCPPFLLRQAERAASASKWRRQG